MRFPTRALGRAWALLLLAVLATPGAAQPFGIDARVPNTSLLIDDLPADPGAMVAQQVFPQIFTGFRGTGVVQMPGLDRFIAIEQMGEALTFPTDDPDPAPSEANVFLDLTSTIFIGGFDGGGGEGGLLGVACDPDFGTNGYVYFYYTVQIPGYTYLPGMDHPQRTVVARFTCHDPLATFPVADPLTEFRVLELDQPFSNHNGGQIAFGPDGMLYIALGDGGNEFGSPATAQDLTNLFGSILRIDVAGAPDPGLDYAIPPDNPFVGMGGGVREEIFAYGLRNPWRFSFDQLTGELWAGDVGGVDFEEINIVEAGNNYGWPIVEGTDCYIPASGCDQTGLTPPIAGQDRPPFVAITGGFVYRGSAVPELFGTYIYGDFINNGVWGLRHDGAGNVVFHQQLASLAGTGLVSFGQDESGEVYLLVGGGFYVLRPSTPTMNDFPTRLSDIPALLAAGMGTDQTNLGIIPYEPSAKLWSDGTLKERFLALPGTTQATYQQFGGWDFPEETVVIKNFSLPLDFRDPSGTAQRIETRLLIRNGGAWHGFSYEWNEEQTDALLLPESGTDRAFSLIDASGTPFAYSWHYPGRSECAQCHTDAANNVLGLQTAQLNSMLAYPDSGVTDNQLRTLDHIGFFDAPLPGAPAALPAIPDPFDLASGATTQERARAYLHANCAQCHQPGTFAHNVRTPIDLRWHVDLLSEAGIVGVRAQLGDLGLFEPSIVEAGDPSQSVLPERMNRRDGFQMPPLATSIVDDEAVALIQQWILELGGPSAATEDWTLHR